MRLYQRTVAHRTFTIALVVACILICILAASSVYAFPGSRWTVQSNERLEVLRDYACFGEGKPDASKRERETSKVVTFSRDVLSAEAFLSGFDIWYTQEGNDHEVIQLRVDAMVNAINVGTPCQAPLRCIGTPDPKNVSIKLIYSMADEDLGDSDDYSNACIGFTVLARTK
ncbi:hypothetical protein [Caldilinea sp.]|uniref:hypothetical protein n=1 Tax=Caldilinea sp. TaxID=2293560 RepID=UPI002CA500FC|nr:hypothetical protein [Caldilinea sp.]